MIIPRFSLLFLISALLSPACLHAELRTLTLTKPPRLTKAELHHETGLPATQGVLVLLPGMNGNGAKLAQETAWRNFARENRLGLVGVSFVSPPQSLYGHPASGYYYPEQGSGKALLGGLRKIYGKSPKILLYGFSGGAQFGSRFAEQHPGDVLGWAAYSASFWGAPVHATPASPPGIVACGEFDATRYGPSFAYFQQGRRKEARWTWVSLGQTGHVRHKSFEDFVRAYFTALLAGNFDQAQWRDAQTGQATAEDERLLNPALSLWLPTPELADSWLKLHHP